MTREDEKKNQNYKYAHCTNTIQPFYSLQYLVVRNIVPCVTCFN